MQATRERPMRRLVLAARLAVLGIGGAVPWSATQGQAVDSLTTWLDWGSTAFLVKADTAHGVQLWVGALVARKDGAQPRSFVARYDPDAVMAWALDAELLPLPDRAGPNDPPKVLALPPLTDLRYGKFLAFRRREGSRWANQVVLSFTEDGRDPLAFSVERAQAAELFAALAQGARRSRLRDRVETSWLDECGNMVTPSLEPEHVATPVLRYPSSLGNRGMPGLTVVSFIVDTTGRALLDEGFRVIFSTDPAFTQAARDAVAASRYRPATRDGQAHRASVCESYTFMITINPRDVER